MAFNLRSLGVRSLSAVFFVVLLLGSLAWNYLSFTVFFLFVSLGALYEFNNLMEHMNTRPLRAAGYVCALLLYGVFIRADLLFGTVTLPYAVYAAAAIPAILCAASIFINRADAMSGAMASTFGITYCVLPFALMHELVVGPQKGGPATYDPATLLGVILLIWSNDTFAYLSGNIAGRHKMAERISPGKTWEGTIGGLLITFGLSFLLGRLVGSPHPTLWPVLGVAVPILSTVGDLVQSQLKRKAGVKDAGRIMPGHGGVLDRFDSLIFVIPFVFAAVKLLELH